MCMAFIDHEKPFDSVQMTVLLEAIGGQEVEGLFIKGYIRR